MYDLYINKLNIEKVRHLKNIEISLNGKKHLIFTGKNGSGKTSVLEALAKELSFVSTNASLKNEKEAIEFYEHILDRQREDGSSKDALFETINYIEMHKKAYNEGYAGLDIGFSCPEGEIKSHFSDGDFVIAYYNATRKLQPEIPQHVEKIKLQKSYDIYADAKDEFVKYIVDLKMTEALSKTSGKIDKAESIKHWFECFQNVLKEIFEDESAELIFDEDTFSFYVSIENREKFDFKSLSDGYAAVMDIIVDLIIRMSSNSGGVFRFNIPGIVLIDEIETHLHLELQKKVMNLLMGLFPNVQFILSTHSPFVLSSVKNAVIYDLENKVVVKDGLTDLPYEGIVEGYFGVDKLSDELKIKFDQYRTLVAKDNITDDDMEQIVSLEMYLDEIPDYLALDITTEYHRLKNEFDAREDL